MAKVARVALLLLAGLVALASGQVDEVLKWQRVEYDVPAEVLQRENGYIPIGNIPMGAVHHKNRVFVAVARRRWGIPSTLNVVDLSPPFPNTNVILKPYPNFALNELRVSVGAVTKM